MMKLFSDALHKKYNYLDLVASSQRNSTLFSGLRLCWTSFPIISIIIVIAAECI